MTAILQACNDLQLLTRLERFTVIGEVISLHDVCSRNTLGLADLSAIITGLDRVLGPSTRRGGRGRDAPVVRGQPIGHTTAILQICKHSQLLTRLDGSAVVGEVVLRHDILRRYTFGLTDLGAIVAGLDGINGAVTRGTILLRRRYSLGKDGEQADNGGGTSS